MVEIRRTRDEKGTSAALAFLASKARHAMMRIVVFSAELLVDRRYGMTTRGIVRNELALRASADHADSNHYQAISLRGFREVVSAADVDPGTTAFVDLGAGRGRALILAAEHGFTDVLGVELDPELAEQARRNVGRWEERRAGRHPTPAQIEVRTDDAARIELPKGPMLLFLYNSFGPATLRTLLGRVVASYEADPRPVRLCYFNPVHADVAAHDPALSVAARGDGWLVYALG
jgi:SAM-dependent methyltransferase